MKVDDGKSNNCDQCDRSFKSKSGLSSHLKTHKPVDKVNGKTSLLEECVKEDTPVIDDEITPPDLTEYLPSMHRRKPRYGCDQCEFWSICIKNMNSHMYYEHWMPDQWSWIWRSLIIRPS